MRGCHGSRPALARVATLMLPMLALLGDPASSTTATVPGDFPTLQAVADWTLQPNAHVDTVVVLPEVPFEPTQFWYETPWAVIGRPDSLGNRPRIGALSVIETHMIFRDLRVDGPLRYGNANVECYDCELDSTVVYVGASEPGELRLGACTLWGNPAIDALQYVQIDSCQVHGPVAVNSAADGALVARHNVFTGPGNCAITAYITCCSEVTGNVIRGFENGIRAGADGIPFSIRDNLIEDCSGAGIIAEPTGFTEVVGNVIRRCGTGIGVHYGDGVLSDNLIVDCTGDGIRIVPDLDCLVERNVVSRCANGIVYEINNQDSAAPTFRNNTSHGNRGSGFVLTLGKRRMDFTHNIAHANLGFGVAAIGPVTPITACNDWFGNGAGDVSGFTPASTDRSVDPLFCDSDHDDFTLRADSPLLDASGCGLIGALGMGCGATATLVRRFVAERVSTGIRIEWSLAGGMDGEIWLQRSGWNAPSWTTVGQIDAMEGDRLDRDVVFAAAYRYRLIARNGYQEVVIGAPILVQAANTGRVSLSATPNPGHGEVRIDFTLEQGGSVELDVFDLQGRHVTRLKRGMLPSGVHQATWSGATQTGGAGLYFLRLRHPGGEESLRIVQTR